MKNEVPEKILEEFSESNITEKKDASTDTNNVKKISNSFANS
jgi:hypothetical protein